MIELLEQLVRPSAGEWLLERVIAFVVPISQGLLAAVVAMRLAWLGVLGSSTQLPLGPMWAGMGSILVRGVIVGWMLGNWKELTTVALQESLRVTAAIAGSGVSPERLAARMIALVAHFGEGSILGLLDALAPSPGVNARAPTPAESMTGLGGALGMLLAQIAAAAIVVMIAVPQLLLAVCLGVGPLAIAASVAENQLTIELLEGWAETTASALLTLPAMAVLLVFLGNIPMPVPTQVPGATDAAIQALARLAGDLAVLLLIGQLAFIVLPIASGIVQGRPPGPRGLVALVLAACLLPLKAAKAGWAARPRS